LTAEQRDEGAPFHIAPRAEHSASEMQEGIAMGEIVPDSIIIVTQFLGFIAVDFPTWLAVILPAS
jgi:hypothetical protein